MGVQRHSVATSNDRPVGEFFAIKNGQISHVQAVLFNLPDSEPTGWPATDYAPDRGSVDFYWIRRSNRRSNRRWLAGLLLADVMTSAIDCE